MRKVLFFSLALAVLLLAVTLLGCGGGKSPTASNLNGSTYGSIDEALAELEALTPPEGVDPSLFEQLKEEFRKQLEARGGKITSMPPVAAVDDLTAPDPQPDPDNPYITWTGGFFPGDGTGNGIVQISDITPIAVHFNQQWGVPADPGYNLLSRSADYNQSGNVAIDDVTPVAVNFNRDVSYFIVEWNADPDDPLETWSAMGEPVLWTAHEAELNEYGLVVFVFPLDTLILEMLSALSVDTVYLRVTPYDAADVAGTPCDPITVPVEGPEPTLITVTDILVDITGATNTGGVAPYDGTEQFDAVDNVTDVSGETPANTELTVVLADIAYSYNSTPYNFGDAPPPEITTAEWDTIWAALHASMTYEAEDTVAPIDAEAWTVADPQPVLGYQGFAGPNDPDDLHVTATMADNDYTLGASSFSVNVMLDLTEDVNAPEITNFNPTEQPRNKSQLVSILLDWGEDQTSTELPADTNNGLALFNATTGAFVRTFTAASPVETTDPPTVLGEYTVFRIIGPPDATVIQVLIPANLAEGDYIWRVAEDDGGFERRSSLKKPGDLYTVIGPEYFDMYTWPQGGLDGEFSYNSTAQPYLYFFPQDPKIRRDPRGHPSPPPADPPEFIADNETAYNDFVKGDASTGQEFQVIFPGVTPPTPASPRVYYLYGTTYATTVAEADGELSINYRQPHMIAATVYGMLDTEGDIAFSLFDESGTLLGYVLHYAVGTPLTRSAPVITGCDFGVRPWGAGLSAEDFSDKSASLGASDVVIFTAKNVWLRHDTTNLMNPDWKQTLLNLYLLPAETPKPDHVLRPRIVGAGTNDLVYLAIDVANPEWLPSGDPFAFGESYRVDLTTPNAGFVTYPDTLFIVP